MTDKQDPRGRGWEPEGGALSPAAPFDPAQRPGGPIIPPQDANPAQPIRPASYGQPPLSANSPGRSMRQAQPVAQEQRPMRNAQPPLQQPSASGMRPMQGMPPQGNPNMRGAQSLPPQAAQRGMQSARPMPPQTTPQGMQTARPMPPQGMQPQQGMQPPQGMQQQPRMQPPQGMQAPMQPPQAAPLRQPALSQTNAPRPEPYMRASAQPAMGAQPPMQQAGRLNRRAAPQGVAEQPHPQEPVAHDLTAQLEDQRARAMDEYTRRPPRKGEPMYEPQSPQRMPDGVIPGVGIPSSHWEQQRGGRPVPPAGDASFAPPAGYASVQSFARPTQPPQTNSVAGFPQRRVAQGMPAPAGAPAQNTTSMPMQSAAPAQNAMPAFDPAYAAQRTPEEGVRRRRSARAPEGASPREESSPAPIHEVASFAAPAAEPPRPARRAQRSMAEVASASPSYADTFAAPPTTVDDAVTPARRGRRERALDVPHPEQNVAAYAPVMETQETGESSAIPPVEGYQTPDPKPVPNAFFSLAGKRLRSLPAKAWIAIGVGAAVLIALIVLLATGALNGGAPVAATMTQGTANPYTNAPDGLSAAGQGEAPVVGWTAEPTAEPPLMDAATSADSPRIDAFTAEPASGAAPVSVSFTLAGNDKISSLKLMRDDGTQLSATLQTMPSATGMTYIYTTRFEEPYSGVIRVYLMDMNGDWHKGTLECTVNYQ